MDWFKYFKRKGTPLKYGREGLSFSWIYKLSLQLGSGFIPELQIQIFEDGFPSSNPTINVKPREIRISLVTVPAEVGYTYGTGIIISQEELNALKKADRQHLWSLCPKQQINEYMNANRNKLYICFMKKIFEHPLEK